MKFEMKPYMEQIIESYYKNNSKKLHDMVDRILQKLHFYNVDNDDFYSLANEIFIYTLMDYEQSQSFDGFLYSCLYKKFCTEMTSRTRDKRCLKIKVKEKDENGNIIETTIIVPDERLDTPIGDDENSTIGDMIADDFSVEKEILKKDEREEWKKEIIEYLNGLSPLQRKIALLLSDNNTPNEICEELHITLKHFENSMKRILADEKIKPLKSLIGRI